MTKISHARLLDAMKILFCAKGFYRFFGKKNRKVEKLLIRIPKFLFFRQKFSFLSENVQFFCLKFPTKNIFIIKGFFLVTTPSEPLISNSHQKLNQLTHKDSDPILVDSFDSSSASIPCTIHSSHLVAMTFVYLFCPHSVYSYDHRFHPYSCVSVAILSQL